MKLNLTTILIAIIVILLATLGYILFTNQSLLAKTEPVAITGTLNINGVIPEGATIAITERPLNHPGAPTTFTQGLPAADNGSWNFSDAVSGETYELQALVQVNGETVAYSTPIHVTAPASHEELVVNLEADNPSVEPATISGYVHVNGYIPAGATIRVLGKTTDEAEYTTVAGDLPGRTKQFMSYTTAISGTTYQVIGQLYDVNGVEVGSSNTLIVTAPAHDELLVINSKAQPPATPTPAPQTPTPTVASTTVSGSIDFNGAAPPNSRIVIFQKENGQQNFLVALDNVIPLDGTTWQWNQAKNATWYDLVAILKQRQSDGTDKDIARSTTMTVASPANNIQLTINSGVSLPAPTGAITVTCNSQSGNAWNTTLNFQSVSGAQSYWFQIGSTNGGADRMNQTQNSNNNPLQTITTTFQNGTTYYARYAYATVPNAPSGSSDYSGFSATTPLICKN